jgi:hypothetical protein
MGRACYFHSQLWSVVVPSRNILNLPQRKHAFCHAPKDGMLSVQEGCGCCSNEELCRVNSCRRALRELGLTWQPLVFGPEFACEGISEGGGGGCADGGPLRGDLEHHASQ